LERIARAFDLPQFCNMLIGGATPNAVIEFVE
jgi:hypothetical protein